MSKKYYEFEIDMVEPINEDVIAEKRERGLNWSYNWGQDDGVKAPKFPEFPKLDSDAPGISISIKSKRNADMKPPVIDKGNFDTPFQPAKKDFKPGAKRGKHATKEGPAVSMDDRPKTPAQLRAEIKKMEMVRAIHRHNGRKEAAHNAQRHIDRIKKRLKRLKGNPDRLKNARDVYRTRKAAHQKLGLPFHEDANLEEWWGKKSSALKGPEELPPEWKKEYDRDRALMRKASMQNTIKREMKRGWRGSFASMTMAAGIAQMGARKQIKDKWAKRGFEIKPEDTPKKKGWLRW